MRNNMQKVFTADNFIQLDQLRALLLENGIDCMHKGETSIGAGGAGGEVPPIAIKNELHIFEDSDLERAKELIEEFLTAQNNRQDWTCADCGEHLTKDFSDCWNCASDEVESA